VSDIGWIQWGEGTVTGGVSVRDLFPEKNFTLPPELPLWWFWEERVPLVNVTMDITTSKSLLNGSLGLFTVQNVGTYLETVGALNWTAVFTNWHMTEEDTLKFTPYLLGCAERASFARLQQVIDAGGGLIVKRTAHEWLWGVIDPLLALIQPGNDIVRFNRNYTSEADTIANQIPSTMLTGKNDSSKTMWMREWNGMSEISAYPTPIPVSGCTEDGQFPPFLDAFSPVYVWNDDYARPFTLEPRGTVEVRGLTLQRYELANETWMLNPGYYQNIQGFGNVTALQQAPIFMGNPHFYMAEDKWRERVRGVRPPIHALDATQVNIEPYSGKVLSVYKNLQVNAYIPPLSPLFLYFYHQVPTDIMYPMFWAYTQTEVTQELADQIRHGIYWSLKAKELLTPICVPIGVVAILVGVFLCGCMGLRKYRFVRLREEGYQSINTDAPPELDG